MTDYNTDRYDEMQLARSLRRGKIRDAGLNSNKLEDADKAYRNAKSVLDGVSYYEKIVKDYEKSTDPKWEDF